MHRKEDAKAVEALLQNLSTEDIVRLLLDKIKQDKQDSIPASIFNTALPPLEAITRFLKDQGKRTNDIARLLNKKPPSISEAYKKAKQKKFKPSETDILIPIDTFTQNPKLSILETSVVYLRNKKMRFTEIAEALGKDPKTIWTCHSRARKKQDG